MLLAAGLVLYGPAFLLTVLGIYQFESGAGSGGVMTFGALWAASIVMIVAGVSYTGS